MKSVIIQIWEEFTSGQCIGDGCSLHIDENSRNLFINSVYVSRDHEILESYERIVGEPSQVLVSDGLFDIIEKEKTIRLMSHELNNLLSMGEIC